MSSDVFFIEIKENDEDESLCLRLEKLLEERKCFSFVQPGDMVAVKTHFGEEGSDGYVRPRFLKMIGGMIKEKKGLPFLTETSTLYSGMRSNAVQHIELANKHGFGFDRVGMPLIMADGLLGSEEVDVEIPGRLYRKVKIAALIPRVNALILVSHFTGHVVTGFGAALKNLGMGLSSRKGKLNQHSTAKPSVKKKKCTGCGMCIRWCPQQTIVLDAGIARIDLKKCTGCAECLTVCRFDAIGYNWGETYEQLQKKVVEHAWGAVKAVKNRLLCINFLTRITKDCDCMAVHQRIFSDIGVLVGNDPVAVDAASLDLLEKVSGSTLAKLAYDIPYRVQIEYAREIGFGDPDYRLLSAETE